MASTVAPAVVQLGRGVAYPFRFENGVVPWNVPLRPTEKEAETAARGLLEAVIGVQIGQFYMARSFGTLAASLRFKNATEANRDRAQLSLKETLPPQVPWAVIAQIGAVTSDDGEDLNVRIGYRFRNTNRLRAAKIPIAGPEEQRG